MSMVLQHPAISRRGWLGLCTADIPRVHSRRGTLIPCGLFMEGQGRGHWIIWKILSFVHSPYLPLLAWEPPCSWLLVSGLPGWDITWGRLPDQTVDKLCCLASVFLLFQGLITGTTSKGHNGWVYAPRWVLVTGLNLPKSIKRSQSAHSNYGLVSWLAVLNPPQTTSFGFSSEDSVTGLW